jgi:polyhydroxyalkanoate synthesis regulator protein
MTLKNKYPQDGRKVFVRYGNRKLYDIETSKYTTVAAVAKLPLGSFVVYDHTSKEDITNDVLLSALNTHFSNNIEAFETVKADLVTRFLQN